jgi:PIN domain nuclease of toxin-antitoxin system
LIVLDTHVLVWWVTGDPARLSAAAADAIAAESARESIIVSSITAWELAQLIDRGRLQLAADLAAWLAAVETIPSVVFVPVDNEVGVKSVVLPGEFHRDPADRIIVATARHFSVPLVTADERIRNYAGVRTIW